MRLGGPVSSHSCPRSWAEIVRAQGFRAAYCPVDVDADEETVAAYRNAAAAADIVIAEVGAWSNPLSPDNDVRTQAIKKCMDSLDLADRIGARCCVNIAGSLGAKWDGPCAADLHPETFDMVVESVREIIDAVKPAATYYTLETMPWMYPNSTDSYLALIKAVNRERFAVHFDPVNLINSPDRYFTNGDVIEDAIDRLGPHIRSCHAKDIVLREKLTVHLDECRPGLGALDYRRFLGSLSRLSPDIPLMLEHLSSTEEYKLATEYVQSVAEELELSL